MPRSMSDGSRNASRVVEDRTNDGRRYRMLNVLDEFSHECLAIRVARKFKEIDVIDVLSDLSAPPQTFVPSDILTSS
jgi:hypothetical protein